MKTVLGVGAALLLTFSFTGCCCLHGGGGCGYDPCCDPCGGYGGYGGGYGGACQPMCDPCAGGGWYGGGGYGGYGQGCCPQTNCCHEWDDDWCEDRCGHHGHHGCHRCCLLDFLSIFHLGCGCLGGCGVGACAPSYVDPCCDPCGGAWGAGGQYAPGYPSGGYPSGGYMMPTQPIPANSPPTSMVPYGAHIHP